MMRRVIALFVAVLSVAAAPPGADPALHTWFERQHSMVGDWCCSVADGHILADSEWRVSGGRYEIWVNEVWHVVPGYAQRDPRGGPNPTGHAIAWWTQVGPDLVIHCFEPGTEL
jgi:hypothetical protein